jgi:hypothetical protein
MLTYTQQLSCICAGVVVGSEGGRVQVLCVHTCLQQVRSAMHCDLGSWYVCVSQAGVCGRFTSTVLFVWQIVIVIYLAISGLQKGQICMLCDFRRAVFRALQCCQAWLLGSVGSCCWVIGRVCVLRMQYELPLFIERLTLCSVPF